jgi:hypothetical protein
VLSDSARSTFAQPPPDPRVDPELLEKARRSKQVF